MRSKFDEQLELLNKELITMGALCEDAIAVSSKALGAGDIALAKSVQELSTQINHKEREIEGLCLKLLLQQQPIATDLRVISSALKMVTDMERIGDNSGDIAEIVTMDNIHADHDTQNLHDMALAASKMVTDSIDAFVKQDVKIARAVIAYDDVVDGYFNQVKNMLIKQLKDLKTNGEYALDLLMIAKYFERIADHAVNIAKWVLFSITGNREEVK